MGIMGVCQNKQVDKSDVTDAVETRHGSKNMPR